MATPACSRAGRRRDRQPGRQLAYRLWPRHAPARLGSGQGVSARARLWPGRVSSGPALAKARVLGSGSGRGVPSRARGTAPTNRGDLNPIETIWASLWKELAKQEQQGLQQGKVISVPQFKRRAAQILEPFSNPKPGKRYSNLSKLVRGTPKRLAKSKANKFGPCGN